MIEGNIDLHVHSNFSDGTLSPKELISLAEELSLRAIALTDHDTVEGVNDFLAAGSNSESVKTIPGVEISTNYMGRELHIVGLFIDHENLFLLEFLEEVRKKRHQRNLEMAARISCLGYPVSLDDLDKIADGNVIGRPHFARFLVDNYEFETMYDVFAKVLRRGTPGYVARKLPSPAEAIEAIHQAGGVAVWAHPIYRDRKERSWCRKVLKHLVPSGLDGIEAYYTSFGLYQTQVVEAMAKEFGLAVSGGSDFHGSNQPGIMLGSGKGELKVPADLLSELSRRAKGYILDL
jgi:predicted metal-dependent phosphoesterase TrpH